MVDVEDCPLIILGFWGIALARIVNVFTQAFEVLSLVSCAVKTTLC